MDKSSGNSRAAKNKQIRKEALRDQLSQQKHIEHVVDITEKLSKLENEFDNLEVQRLKIAAELKLKLINKYLPDLKAVELTGKDGSDFIIRLTKDDNAVL